MKSKWTFKNLGDVCHVIGGGTPSKDRPDFYGGDIPWATIRDMRQDWITETEHRITQDALKNSAANVIPEGNVVIATRVGLGKVSMVAQGTAINQDLRGIVPMDRRSMDPRFLFWWAKNVSPLIVKAGTGATVQGVKVPFVKSLKIPVLPISEQRRIVSILDEAFDSIATAKANAEKNLRNARAVFESYLEGIFSKRGEGWVDQQLSSLCSRITVGHVGSMATQYKQGGVPFLRSQNIRPFEVFMEGLVFIDEKFHQSLEKSRLSPGDLAIVRTGYPGTAAVIPPELPDANCSDLVIVRPGKQVSPHFLAAFFNSAFGKQLVLGKIVGAAQKHFNVTAAKEVMLHVPPIIEQQAIVGRIDVMRKEAQRLESIYQRKLAALDELKQSLLHQAFSGAL